MRTQGFLHIPLAAIAVGFFAYSGSAQPVTMTVDATKTGAPISPYLYGFSRNFMRPTTRADSGPRCSETGSSSIRWTPARNPKLPGAQEKGHRAQVQAPGSGRVRGDGPEEGLRG